MLLLSYMHVAHEICLWTFSNVQYMNESQITALQSWVIFYMSVKVKTAQTSDISETSTPVIPTGVYPVCHTAVWDMHYQHCSRFGLGGGGWRAKSWATDWKGRWTATQPGLPSCNISTPCMNPRQRYPLEKYLRTNKQMIYPTHAYRHVGIIKWRESITDYSRQHPTYLQWLVWCHGSKLGCDRPLAVVSLCVWNMLPAPLCLVD